MRKIGRLLQTAIKPITLLPILLMSLVLGAYWTYSEYISARFPYQAYDPEYAYFLSSLEPFRGAPYTYVDHPGTPVEIVGTLVLRGMQAASHRSRAQLIQHTLEDPSLFFQLVHGFLLVSGLVAVALFYGAARSGTNWRDAMAAMSLALMFFVIHPTAFTTLTYWSHNSFNYAFGTLFLICLFKILQQRGEIPPLVLVVMGGAAGILTAVVVYFASWIIGASVAIGISYALQKIGWRRSAVSLGAFLVSCLMGFFVVTLPARSSLSGFFHWMLELVLHQGRYGNGDPGFTTLPLMLQHLADLFHAAPLVFLFAAVGILLMVLAAVKQHAGMKDDPAMWGLAIGLTVQILILFVVILKHPGTYYLLAVAAVLPVLLLALRELLQRNVLLSKVFDLSLVAFILPGVVVASIVSADLQRSRIGDIVRAQAEIVQMVHARSESTGKAPGNVVIVWGYGIYVQCNALIRINNNYINQFGSEVANICPNQYAINDTYLSEPIAGSSAGASVNLNSITWDLIVIRKATAGNLLLLLDSDPLSRDLAGTGTSLPGYRETDTITVLEHQP